ncbi:uracil-DNA glycosylase [Malassezia yamatoensis]|uniref:Uracil-DNA glycosylase n=1 Tax=Malassezia yamatoensis TaxID=253288 RepID=A0AAJ5YR00_9BASI|nr:uracil-DNA glycosylase [Malassezia yamatoensis]
MSPAAKRAKLSNTTNNASVKRNDDFDEFDIPEEDLLYAVQNAETEKNHRLSLLEEGKASQLVSDKHYLVNEAKQKPVPSNTYNFPPTPPSSSPNTDLGKVNRSIPPAPTYDEPYSGTGDDPLALERTTMNKEWFDRLEPAMHKDTFTKLKQFLDAEKRSGKTIYPPAQLIHSWSRTTPLESVKVVILGQDPYHQPGQACGHSFSVPMGKAVPASLQNIYKELKAEFPRFVPPKHGYALQLT